MTVISRFEVSETTSGCKITSECKISTTLTRFAYFTNNMQLSFAIIFEEIKSNRFEWKFSHCNWIGSVEMRAKNAHLPAIWFLAADCVEFSVISTSLLLGLMVMTVSADAADKNWIKSNCSCKCLFSTRSFLIILQIYLSQWSIHEHLKRLWDEKLDLILCTYWASSPYDHQHTLIFDEWISQLIQNNFWVFSVFNGWGSLN